jgi:hypothetical protein
MITNEFYNELSNMNLSSDNLINIICNYFDSNIFEGLLEHIKNEY